MTEHQRRQYNRDVAAVDQLEADVRVTQGVAKRTAIDRLKAAWIAFDEKWNGYTPTDAQMAGWLQSLPK